MKIKALLCLFLIGYHHLLSTILPAPIPQKRAITPEFLKQETLSDYQQLLDSLKLTPMSPSSSPQPCRFTNKTAFLVALSKSPLK